MECHSENTNSSVEDSEFELPMLNQSELENGFVKGVRDSKLPEQSMHLNGGSTMEDIHGGDRKGKFAPFDIENESTEDIRSSNIGVAGANSTVNPNALTLNSNSSVSSADVLKTLFLILVWYTFSTFLTL